MASARAIKSEDVSIASALDTLSSIADLELSSTLQDPLMITPPPKDAPVMLRTVRWLHQKNAERMMGIMREKLHVVLNYLQHFYASEKGRFARKESVEGIRTIMMIVDEASDNLDRYTKLFLGVHAKSIKDTKEFLALCSFYKNKITPIAIHRKIATWISALPITDILTKGGLRPPEWARQIAAAPLSVTLEDIQRDIDYELLLIRKADGSRFFTPKLIRSMRLACHIEKAVDWLGRGPVETEIAEFRRIQAATAVQHILGNCYPVLDGFFHAAHRAKDHQMVLDLYSPCIALMAAALQAVHRTRGECAKGIEEYLEDFRSLFSQFIESSEFKRLFTYPPTNERSWEFAVVRLVESLSSTIIDGVPLSVEFVTSFKGLLAQGMAQAIEELGPPDGTVSHAMNLNYASLRQLIGMRGSATLAHMLHELEMRRFVSFEPLLGEALPIHLYNLSWRGDLIPVVRLPSPTRQEKIDCALPSEVLHIAARRHGRQSGRYLVINLQDRTGWKDGARCQAIEELQRQDEANKAISVLSLSCDGEFYHQEGVFENLTSAERFKEELFNRMTEPNCGVLFPHPSVPTMSSDIREIIDVVHRSLYAGRNRLPKNQRLEFIDLIQLLLMLRVIGQIHPDIIFVSCKDGIDITLPALAGLFAFLKIFNKRMVSEDEMQWLATSLLGIPLIERDRLLFADRYGRLTSLIRFLESSANEDVGLSAQAMRDGVINFLPQEIAYAALLPSSGHQMTYFERRYSM